MFGLGSAPPKHDPPASMEPYDLGRDGDLGALSNAQQGATNKLKTVEKEYSEMYHDDGVIRSLAKEDLDSEV
ncbi:unnamed protein product [Trichobilharzia regenti]|nr:unnamed protein product [Trichobilharzia regenti]